MWIVEIYFNALNLEVQWRLLGTLHCITNSQKPYFWGRIKNVVDYYRIVCKKMSNYLVKKPDYVLTNANVLTICKLVGKEALWPTLRWDFWSSITHGDMMFPDCCRGHGHSWSTGHYLPVMCVILFSWQTADLSQTPVSHSTESTVFY